MNEIYVLITQPFYTHYDFYKTEEEALNMKNQIKNSDKKSYAEVEKWDMVQFANWVARSFESVDSSLRHHIG